MRLRVLDFGFVPALRSQAVYHGVAHTIDAQSDPVLTLVNPETPYVCVGVHQEIAMEVDEEYCRASGLPVIRRHVGGGAVYLDRNQMFFHFMYPKGKVPEFALNLYPRFIEPAVRTYRELGVAAEYRPVNDIQVAGRKIGGTGAASIGEATVMVGSFMFDFDTATMAKCLKVPSEKFRDKLRATLDDYMSTMTRELAQLPSREEVKAIFLRHCADTLGVEPVADEPTAEELEAIAAQEKALSDPDWTYRKGKGRSEFGVKISEGLHLNEAMYKARGGLVRASLLARDGKIENLMLSGDMTCLPEDGIDRLSQALSGARLDSESLAGLIDAEIKRLELDIPAVEAADFAAAIMAAASGEQAGRAAQ
jgi:lipoate---protein ligase